MTLEEIKAFVLSVDPTAKHYLSYEKGESYTTWTEYGLSDFNADNQPAAGYRFQIDRFTKSEKDSIQSAFMAALKSSDHIAFSYTVMTEPDTGYIHHVFDCEGA